MKIISLKAEHASDAARLHISGQPGTFLTSLGIDALTVIYRVLPNSAGGFGFAACAATSHSGQLSASQQTPSQLKGFVSATTSIGQLMMEMATQHIFRIGPLLLRRFIQQPRLFIRTVQTLLYPMLSHSSAKDSPSLPSKSNISEPAVELLSIMVEPDQRGRGIGAELLDHLCQTCRDRSVSVVDVTVDSKNQGARRFYERNGFVHQSDFQIFGRMMCSYRLRL
ncbi:MAG: GNAT family N-acetyltransferase [Chloroflexota bacterium]